VATRFAIGLCVLGLGWTTHVWWPAVPPRATTSVSLDHAGWQAIETAGDLAAFDLAAKPDQRCLLIVASLGDAANTHRVRLESQPTDAAAPRGVSSATVITRNPIPEARWHTAAGLPWHRRSAGADWRADFTTASSPPTPLPQREKVAAALVRSFDIHVGPGSLDDPASYVRVAGRTVAESESVRVFLDDHQPFDQRMRSVADEIVRLLEMQIIPRSRELIGTHADVDGDGKLAVLLTPVLDRVASGQSLGGFVRRSDFRRDASPPFGSHADVIYLNAQVVSPGEHLHALLAHEYTHAVCFSERWRREAAGERVRDEEDWLTEAIAHVAEQRHHAGWSNLDDRIARYLRNPAAAPLVVPDAARAGLWRDPGCRGASYLFLQWCVDQFGDNFLRDVVHTPLRGRANIEHATGVPFAELFRRWTIAVWEACRTKSTDAANAEGYRSLSLHGRLGDVELAGPAAITWHLQSKGGPEDSPSLLVGAGRGEGAKRNRSQRPEARGQRTRHLANGFARQRLVTRVWPPVSDTDPTAPTPLPQGARGDGIEFTLRGTAAAFVELHAPADGRPRRISATADSGAKLQLTLISLAAEESSPVLVAETPVRPR
jgi:hypothetical protein